MPWLQNIFGDANERFLQSLDPLLEKIDKQEQEWSKLSNEELKKQSLELKIKLNLVRP